MLETAPTLAFIGLALIILVMFREILLSISAKYSMPFHEACLGFSPESRHRELYQAIVCGAELKPSDFYLDLRTTGLLHLLVVSGSHLIFLEQRLTAVLQRFKGLRPLIFSALICFTLVARAEPPILRALVSLCLGELTHAARLQWTPAQRTTFSGFVSLTFCHDLRDAQSLILSWGASLALIIFSTGLKAPEDCSFIERAKAALLTHIGVYLVLTPLLLPLTVPHPLSILANWLIAPWLGAALFPASLATYFVPYLHHLVDPLWTATCGLISFVAGAFPENSGSIAVSLSARWSYLAIISCYALWRESALMRKEIRA